MARMPKELMRDMVLNAKEKSHSVPEAGAPENGQETPVEYASRKVISAEERTADAVVRGTSSAGRILAEKSYEKIKERRRGQPMATHVEENTEEYASNLSNGSGKEPHKAAIKNPAKERVKERTISEDTEPFRMMESGKNSPGVEAAKIKAGQEKRKAIREKNSIYQEKPPEAGGIKIRQDRREVFHSGSGRGVKTLSSHTGTPGFSENKKEAVRTLMPQKRIGHMGMPQRKIKHISVPQKAAGQAAAPKGAGLAVVQKKQAEYAMKASKQMAVKSAEAAGKTAQTVKKTTKVAVRGVIAAAKAAVSSTKALTSLAMAGGGLVILLIVIVGVIGGVLLSGNSQSSESLSQEVLDHTPVIQRYARQYGIPEYVQVIQAIMMQESRGQGNDPMQASECPFNTRYPNSPNAITDPEYSIQVGIQYYAYCVREAGCTSPQDLDNLKLSIQGYNFGNGYISWAIRNHGGYSEANALQFSQEQAATHGWSGYGDPEYVPHVMRYYSGGNLFAGLFGNSQMVSVAMAQVGNVGGQKFWSWYGFQGREEWCACFVSWCAEQCGLITSGAVPKFASCPAGVEWFRSNGKWKDNSHSPAAGTIIFFDWDGDGVSDHVGIVEKCENGRVYTVEGNSGDAVRQEIYLIGSKTISGYGILMQ